MLLPVAMAASDALLHALRVPRQVVVDDKRAELQVDAFRASLRADHDLGFGTKVINNRRATVDSWTARRTIGALVCGQPALVDPLGAGI